MAKSDLADTFWAYRTWFRLDLIATSGLHCLGRVNSTTCKFHHNILLSFDFPMIRNPPEIRRARPWRSPHWVRRCRPRGLSYTRHTRFLRLALLLCLGECWVHCFSRITSHLTVSSVQVVSQLAFLGQRPRQRVTGPAAFPNVQLRACQILHYQDGRSDNPPGLHRA